MFEKTMAPRKWSCSMARRNSAPDAAGSLRGSVASAANLPFFSVTPGREGVLPRGAQPAGGGRFFHVRAGGGQGDDLGINSLLAEHLLAVIDVAMATHRHVVVAGIVQPRIALGVMRDAHCTGPFF